MSVKDCLRLLRLGNEWIIPVQEKRNRIGRVMAAKLKLPVMVALNCVALAAVRTPAS